MKPINKDIVGKTFGKLTVLDEYQKVSNGTKWKCECECGSTLYVYRGKLTTGHTKSCGCITKTLNGLSNHPLYKIWWGIKERCYSERHASYHNYGAKGIILSEEWHDFNSFYNWSISNGYKDGLTIDRIHSSGNYEPLNCQWISLSENIARSNKEKQRRKTKYLYYAISPDNEYYTFDNAVQFSLDHNLNDNSIRRVARGERPHYKGWKFGFTDIPNT